MCLSDVPAAAIAPAQRVEAPSSAPAPFGQPTAGAAGAQHTHQADEVRAAAAAADRPADVPQGLSALPVQMAGQPDAAHPSAPQTAAQHRPGLPPMLRQPAAADVPLLEPGRQGERAIAFGTTSGTGFRFGSAHASTDRVAAGAQEPPASAGSGLLFGDFQFGLLTASQVCT